MPYGGTEWGLQYRSFSPACHDTFEAIRPAHCHFPGPLSRRTQHARREKPCADYPSAIKPPIFGLLRPSADKEPTPMQPFTTVTGTGVPLRRSNVDTDQIIPAAYMKRITRTGFEDGLFAAWRKDPHFVLNDPHYAQGRVLIAGPDFGTGSSREHAVWALLDYGFRVVISPRFADIFRSNAGKAGLLAAQVSETDIEALWEVAERSPGVQITVDLHRRSITAGRLSRGFDVDDYTRWRLLNGLDDIDLTLQHSNAIADFEQQRPAWLPTTLPHRR